MAAGEDRTLSRSFSFGRTLNHSASGRTDPQNLSLTRERGGEGVHMPVMRNGVLKVFPQDSAEVDPRSWIPGKPPDLREAVVLFLSAQKGSNEFLEVRMVVQAGSSPAQDGTASLLLWEPPLGSLWGDDVPGAAKGSSLCSCQGTSLLPSQVAS